MLKQILLKNFKSYQDQVLALAPLTLMIGANASGKSNAIEAFRFLSWLAKGQKLSILQNVINDSDKILRGRVSDLGYQKSDQFTVGCVIDDVSEWNKLEVVLEARNEDPSLAVNNELHIIQEQLISNKSKPPLYKIKEKSSGLQTDIQVEYYDFSPDTSNPEISCTDQMAIMCQLNSQATFSKDHPDSQIKIPQAISHFQESLNHTLFLDPIPSLMRDDSLPSSKLKNNCSNLAGVLYYLWDDIGGSTVGKSTEDLTREIKAKSVGDFFTERTGLIAYQQAAILRFIQSLPEQEIIDLKFYKDERRGLVTLELIESFGGKERACPIELLSDGTLRVLAIAAAILSAPKGSTVVIEEVDNGIHPSRAKHLLQTMYKEARQRNINLLLSTHNPALMDALPDETLGDVVFCYRDPQKGDSRLTRLSDLDNYAGLIMQSSLGDLVTRGIVDRYVKNPVTSEERKQSALQWLETMNGDQDE